MTTTIAPYGSWRSPITSDLIVAETIRLMELQLDDEDLYWLEMRPGEMGRYALVHRDRAGNRSDAIPSEYNVRTRVHEYGGAAYAVRNGVIAFCHFADQKLYLQQPDGAPKPLTPDGFRYADISFDDDRHRLIAVREDHATDAAEAVNTIVAIDVVNGGAGEILAGGYDFYSTPRLSPAGNQLTWLAWNHPDMPWTTTELWLADVAENGTLVNARCIAGGDDESIFQPSWSPDGALYFVSDRTNWWNLYRWQEGESQAIAPLPAEFGTPGWTFGMSTYGFVSADEIVAAYTQNGAWHLANISLERNEFATYDLPYSSISAVKVGPDDVSFIGGSSNLASAIIRMDLATMDVDELKVESTVPVEVGYLSVPEAIDFPSRHGAAAHAIYYPPTNADFEAPTDEAPPLLVMSHGGPTGATSSSFSLSIQYWTSRGIAVVDVNYGGSTGYGREYRMRLNGTWGIVDIDDCVDAARSLVARGLADEERLLIRGGSAGGYTTLAALTFEDTFKAGASYFGVSDLGALAAETHKFESRYLDNLIGPYPERKDLYEERSPLFHADRLSCPVIFFQGLEDKIVLPNQAEMMVEALRKKGVPVAYLAFEGEQHGFRQAENIKRTLDAELFFYSRVVGFELADPVEPVEIENLKLSK